MPLLASRFAALSLLGPAPPLLVKDDASTARADLDFALDELALALILDELVLAFPLAESFPRRPARRALTCPLFTGAPGLEVRLVPSMVTIFAIAFDVC